MRMKVAEIYLNEELLCNEKKTFSKIFLESVLLYMRASHHKVLLTCWSDSLI